MTDLLKAHSLLVVPSDDLRGMLGEGPCGFRPPVAYEWQGVKAWRPYTGALPMLPRHQPFGRLALVLRWEGQDLPHGWVTAGMACGWPPSICLPPTPTPQRRFLLSLEARGCTIIALDEQGKEIDHD